MGERYPKWKYHRELAAVIVQNENEEAALGEGWEDTPAAFAEAALQTSALSEPAAPVPEKPKRKR
jgi:hypothetical protein